MSFPPASLEPIGLRHGIRHCPGGDDEVPCINPGFGGKVYYVDPVNGLDTYDGRAAYFMGGTRGPWQTLTYAFSAASPLGVASAGVKGAYHDYLVALPGIYEALETWPLTVPATKDCIHVIGSAMPGFNGPVIGTLGAYTTAHATEPTLVINGANVTVEGIKIIGPSGDFPVVQINDTLAVLRYNWLRARDDGGNGADIPAAGTGWFSRLEHNWIGCYVDTAVGVEAAEESLTILDNIIHSEGGGIDLADEAHWPKITYNRIANYMATAGHNYELTFGIRLQAGALQAMIDENRIGPAVAGTSGVQRRIYDLSAAVSNMFGRNYQLGAYEAGPPAGINRAGDLITDGGIGSGYSRD
jgi:hypothetical protein